MRVPLIAALLTVPTAALSSEVACDLVTAARNSGLITLDYLAAFAGISLIVGGLLYIAWGTVKRIVREMRILLEVVGYASSAALIAAYVWAPGLGLPHYVPTLALGGCLLFMGTVFLTIHIHEIEGDDPKQLALLFTLVWGAVAIFYDDVVIAGFSVLAFMNVIGFTIVVGTLSYGFGFDDDEHGHVMARATTTTIIIGALAVIQQVWYPDAPRWIAVFSPGAILASSFVTATGLLIMSSRYISFRRGGTMSFRYLLLNIVALAAYVGMITVGLILLPQSPLLSMGYVFIVLYLAAKPAEIPARHYLAVGCVMILSGSVLYGGYHYRDVATKRIEAYISQLPKPVAR